MRIGYKKLSIAVAAIIALLQILFFKMTFEIKMPPGGVFTAGPRFYPMLLTGCTFAVCVLSIILTARKKEDKILEIPHINKNLFFIVTAAVWAAVWELTGDFYIISFFCTGLLIHVFNPAPNSPQKWRTTVVADVIITAFVYVIFELLLKIKL